MPQSIMLTLWMAAASSGWLEWSGPPSCPDASQVDAQLQTLLPHGPSPSASALFTATVRATADDFVLEFRGDDPTAPVRTLYAPDCQTLAASAVLIAAIELEPLDTAAATMIPPAPDADPPAPDADQTPPHPPKASVGVDPTPAPVSPAPSRPLPAEPDPSPPRPRAWIGLLRVHGGGGWMGLPRSGPLFGGAVGLGVRRLRGELGVEVQPRQNTTYPQQTSGAELRMVAGTLRACPTLRRGVLEIPLCAGLWLGALRGEGRGVTTIRTATDLWIALEAHGAVAWSMNPWLALRAGAGPTLALRRPAFLLRDRPVLFRTPRFGARVSVGLELKFFARRRTESSNRGD